ncbi:MAG: sigma-70 family RNA polymerase sigma factor [Verrucomicrobiota bacterium]
MDREPAEMITGLLMKHFDVLLSYVISLVGNETDARDIMQNTSMSLIRKAGSYDSSRSFVPWACRFAYLETLKFREKRGRRPLLLEDDVLELIANEGAERVATADVRRDALEICFAKLAAADQRLLALRYHDELSTEEICSQMETSRRSVFRRLKEIRESLRNCISREVSYA